MVRCHAPIIGICYRCYIDNILFLVYNNDIIYGLFEVIAWCGFSKKGGTTTTVPPVVSVVCCQKSVRK